MGTNPINIRAIDGAEVLDVLNCAYIADRFFGRSRAWFTQRLNNNLVNGKPVGFNPEELRKLRLALRSLSIEINKFTTHIPNQPTDMSVQVYVISEPEAVALIEEQDLDGFRQLLAEDDTLYFAEPVTFDTEAEAIAFCDGLAHGLDERAPANRIPLLTTNDSDLPFIEAIKAY